MVSAIHHRLKSPRTPALHTLANLVEERGSLSLPQRKDVLWL